MESGALSHSSVTMFKNTYAFILYFNFLLKQRISNAHFPQNVFSESTALGT